MPDELRAWIRPQPVPSAAVVVRGGPDTTEKLTRHASRLHRLFVFDGRPIWGVSAYVAAGARGEASVPAVLGGMLSSYRLVYVTTTETLAAAGCLVVPTFATPHVTVLVSSAEQAELEALLVAFGTPRPNPYYDGPRRGRSRRA